MRLVLSCVLVVVTACDSKPKRPDLATFEQLPLDKRCDAIAPRVLPCLEQVITERSRRRDDGTLRPNEIVEGTQTAQRKEARRRLDTICLSDLQFPKRVVSCWDAADCSELAICAENSRLDPKSD